MDVSLFTGRHHQIRAQLANAGCPIWGDQRYNPAAKAGQQVALWAYSLTIEHPTLKQEMTFTLPPHGAAWEPFETELKALCGGVRIVYADENILCCNKAAGMSVAAADGGDSLQARLEAALGERVYPVHRLDVATGGLVLFARNGKAEAELNAAIESRSIKSSTAAPFTGACHSGKRNCAHTLLRMRMRRACAYTTAPAPMPRR